MPKYPALRTAVRKALPKAQTVPQYTRGTARFTTPIPKISGFNRNSTVKGRY